MAYEFRKADCLHCGGSMCVMRYRGDGFIKRSGWCPRCGAMHLHSSYDPRVLPGEVDSWAGIFTSYLMHDDVYGAEKNTPEPAPIERNRDDNP